MMVMSCAWRGCWLRSEASTFMFGSRTFPYVDPSRLSAVHGISSVFACASAYKRAQEWSSHTGGILPALSGVHLADLL